LLLRVAALAFGLVLAGFASGHIVRGVASFLVIEDPLQPAAAIISLGGKLPFREIEAARLYREGWAPRVIIVRATASAESELLRTLEINKPEEWELSRAVLEQQGVPASAIVIPKDEGVGTLEELQAAWGTIQHGAWSREAAHAKESTEHGAGSVEPAVFGKSREQSAKGKERGADGTPKTQEPTPDTLNAARANANNQKSEVGDQKSDKDLRRAATNAINANNAMNATNAINALPVILVTSKYHTRRTRLTWSYVTRGRSQPIVRGASLDPFDAEHWWQERRSILAVVRVYLGLVNYYAGFPVAS
jgi:uncharacterized SAM-binding protein YcdF (DUF218 family)